MISTPPARGFFCLRPTRFGPVGVLWGGAGDTPLIYRILLSKPGESAEAQAVRGFPGTREATCPKVDALAGRIAGFLEGADVRFSLDEVTVGGCAAFQQSVLRAEHAIPRGRISTYGLMARRLGNPRGSRAVGTALATNPFPIVVPCHRAIRSDGTLGGYQGGLEMKRTLLEMEGIAFRDARHVAPQAFFYDDTTRRTARALSALPAR